MNITQLLADVRQRLVQAEARRQTLRDELMQVEMELNGAQREYEVLRGLAERWNIEVPEDAEPVSEEAREWLAMPRTSAIVRILAEARTPMSPTEIVSALADKGREDSPAVVSAALAYLKKENRAVQRSRGAWVHASRQSSPAPASLITKIAQAWVENQQTSIVPSWDAQGRSWIISPPRPVASEPHQPDADEDD